MKRSKSSKDWLKQHEADPYVKRARAEGWRSRAAYKLLEIQQKSPILFSGACVIDLGAAPGSWCQVAKTLIGHKGKIIALDCLPMDPIADVQFIQGDFTEATCLAELQRVIGDSIVNVVLSDMAPNTSGHRSTDQVRVMVLVELAFDLAKQVLRRGGSFVCKLFHGEGFDEFVKTARKQFTKVIVFKPQSSRSKSNETYLIATGFR